MKRKSLVQKIGESLLGIGLSVVAGCGVIDGTGLPAENPEFGRQVTLYEGDLQENLDEEMSFQAVPSCEGMNIDAVVKAEKNPEDWGREPRDPPFDVYTEKFEKDGKDYFRLIFKDNDNDFFSGSVWTVMIRTKNGILNDFEPLYVTYQKGKTYGKGPTKLEKKLLEELCPLVERDPGFDTRVYEVDYNSDGEIVALTPSPGYEQLVPDMGDASAPGNSYDHFLERGVYEGRRIAIVAGAGFEKVDTMSSQIGGAYVPKICDHIMLLPKKISENKDGTFSDRVGGESGDKYLTIEEQLRATSNIPDEYKPEEPIPVN